MHRYRIDDAALIKTVATAYASKAAKVTVPVTFYASLVDGILAADAEFDIRIDVTVGERAAGVLRGESATDIAVRETRTTANTTADQISQIIQERADAQTELHALCVEADTALTSRQDAAEDRHFWRLRAAVRGIRDTLTEKSRSGRKVETPVIPDLNATDAWGPMFVPVGDRLRDVLLGKNPVTAVNDVLEIQDALKRVTETAPVIWRDLTPADIAGMTSDHTIRHLLTKAAELRDQAISVSGTDPERAGAILVEVTRIEREAMEAAIEGVSNARFQRLESVTSVLAERAKNEIRK